MTITPMTDAPVPRSPERLALFVPAHIWQRLLFAAAVVGLVTLLAAGDESVWLAPGVALVFLISAHAVTASRRIPWIPGLIAFIAVLQWVLMPWAAYHVPPTFPWYGMIVPSEQYFAFAVPATMALVAGLYLPLLNIRWRPPRGSQRAPRYVSSLRSTCEWMVWGGLFVRLVVADRVPGGLAFAALLVANFSFVGLFGLVLMRARRWPLRAAAVFAVLVAQSSEEGMFHDLLLWTAYLALVVAFAYRVRLRRIVAFGAFAAALILVLNGLKLEYRAQLSSRPALGVVDRMALVAELAGDFVGNPAALVSPENISMNVTRLNQGWIIARVLTYVPASEPYARGETIVEALRAAFLPRIIAPDKIVVGGHEYFERFTGLELRESTSMDLSVAGEMYANFGVAGGILGVFAFGLLLGLLFRMFVSWSRDSVLWWAWAPFVMLYTARAEGGLAEPLNHVSKSVVVMLFAIAVLPGWAALRRFRFMRRVPLLGGMAPVQSTDGLRLGTELGRGDLR